MRIRLLSLFPFVNATGEEINQGSMVRYLAEGMWYPSALLNDYVSWDSVNDSIAKAVMTYKGITVTGQYSFNRDDDVTGFNAMRYREKNGKYKLENWVVKNEKFKGFNGMRIPYQSEIAWKEGGESFTWLKIELDQVEYGVNEIFEN